MCFLRRINHRPNPMSATSARPPMTPPTIGPIGVLESLGSLSDHEVCRAGVDSVVVGLFLVLILALVETVLELSSSDCEVEKSVDS